MGRRAVHPRNFGPAKPSWGKMILAGKAWNIGSCVTGIGGDNLAGWSHLSIFHTGDAFILSEVKGHLSRFAPDISSAGLQCCDSGVFAGVHFHAMPGFGGAIGGRFQFFFGCPDHPVILEYYEGPWCWALPYHTIFCQETSRLGEEVVIFHGRSEDPVYPALWLFPAYNGHTGVGWLGAPVGFTPNCLHSHLFLVPW